MANKEKKYLFFVVEIPLLFETQQEKFYDYVIVVTKEKKRNKKLDVRENRLVDIDDKIKKADFVITNNSSFTMLKRQVTKIANILIKLIKENTLA